jgi:hypothetical protein
MSAPTDRYLQVVYDRKGRILAATALPDYATEDNTARLPVPVPVPSSGQRVARVQLDQTVDLDAMPDYLSRRCIRGVGARAKLVLIGSRSKRQDQKSRKK